MPIGKKTPDKPKAMLGRKTGKQKVSKKTKEELAEISRQNGRLSADKNASAYPAASEPYNPDYSVEDMYADIYDARAKIAPEVKIHAATAYFATGTIEGASRMTGLSHQTISAWRQQAEWWTPVLSKIRKEKNDELDAEITGLIHKTTINLISVLEEGEPQYYQGKPVEIPEKDENGKPTGKEVLARKPVGGRDLAAILNTLYDKRTMLRGEPTSIRAVQDKGALMQELRGEFSKMAEKELNKRVVSEQ